MPSKSKEILNFGYGLEKQGMLVSLCFFHKLMNVADIGRHVHAFSVVAALGWICILSEPRVKRYVADVYYACFVCADTNNIF
jgi:hypothetical protein